MSEFLTDGSALVEQQSGYETQWLEEHWMGKSTPLGNEMNCDGWVLSGSFLNELDVSASNCQIHRKWFFFFKFIEKSLMGLLSFIELFMW